MAKELEIKLSKPIKYSKGGEMLEESILLFRSPNTEVSSVRRHARRLKNMGLSALRKAQAINDGKEQEDQQTDESAPDDVSGADFMNLLGMAGVDTNELIEAMKSLAPHVTMIGESGATFKEVHWEKLSMQDEEEITGRYVTNFLLNFGPSGPKS